MITLSVVVPCFNEQEVLPETVARLTDTLDPLITKGIISADSEVVFVDDGSSDETWKIIKDYSKKSSLITGIKLSRNRGHQNALLAGLFSARGDAVISVDADLQDDLSAINKMLDDYLNGSDIVYGVRKHRDTDTFLKRLTAESYYRLLALMGVEIIFNHADYRLLSRRAVDSLREFGECNLFLRGLVPQLGYPSSIVYYDRATRFAGESKYPIRKMMAFAWQGITSFSAAPLKAITGIGVLISIGSFAVAAWALWIRLFSDATVPGWASTVVPMYFLGGVQLLCIGIIGEYLAKIYTETKRRPSFFIEDTIRRPLEANSDQSGTGSTN